MNFRHHARAQCLITLRKDGMSRDRKPDAALTGLNAAITERIALFIKATGVEVMAWTVMLLQEDAIKADKTAAYAGVASKNVYSKKRNEVCPPHSFFYFKKSIFQSGKYKRLQARQCRFDTK